MFERSGCRPDCQAQRINSACAANRCSNMEHGFCHLKPRPCQPGFGFCPVLTPPVAAAAQEKVHACVQVLDLDWLKCCYHVPQLGGLVCADQPEAAHMPSSSPQHTHVHLSVRSTPACLFLPLLDCLLCCSDAQHFCLSHGSLLAGCAAGDCWRQPWSARVTGSSKPLQQAADNRHGACQVSWGLPPTKLNKTGKQANVANGLAAANCALPREIHTLPGADHTHTFSRC